MNIFNRLVVILLLLISMVAAVVIMIIPEQTFLLLRAFFEWLRQGTVAYLDSPDRWIFTGARVLIGGAIAIIGLLLLWLELRRPRKRVIRAQKLQGGEANIAIDSIAQRVAYHIDQLPEVIRVAPHISSRPRGVDVDLLLETTPDIDVPMKTEEVLQVTKEVIEERMGLRLGKVTINIKHAPYPAE